MVKIDELKDKFNRWWMCDFCGGMADPINESMFVSCIIGSALGIIIALIFWRLVL